MVLRSAKASETNELVAVAASTGIFRPDEPKELLGSTLDDFHSGGLGPEHLIEVLDDSISSRPAGWVYYSPSFKADGVWDLWWIGVGAAHQRQGYGQFMLDHVERTVAEKGGRLLIIETSSLPTLESARAFYLKNGYLNCGQIPEFYGPADDKVIFSKKLSTMPPTPKGKI